jgi:hypothetical protein
MYWYLNPVRMEGMSNEHKSSTGISDCPTDWSQCKFKCGSAGEWQCDIKQATCSANLPNEAKFDAFIKRLTGSDVIDEDAYINVSAGDVPPSRRCGSRHGGGGRLNS